MPPERAVQPPAAIVDLDLSPCPLEDASVLDSGRAGCFARATSEAAVQVRDERVLDREPSFVDLEDLVNATTR